MADFEYFRAEESDQFSFFRIPKALFTEKEFASLSTDAKLLYGILLDRISLSKKNGWIDSEPVFQTETYRMHHRCFLSIQFLFISYQIS